MDRIELEDILDALGIAKPKDFWFSGDCEINENGISPKALDKHTQDLLYGAEWREFEKFKKDIALKLPCTPQVFHEWMQRNGFDAAGEGKPFPPQPAPVSRQAAREADLKAWLEKENPEIDAMTKKEIHAVLTKREPRLWAQGFDDFWRKQKIVEKKPGRPRNE